MILVAERLNIYVQVSRKFFFTFKYNTNIHTVIHQYEIAENPQHKFFMQP